jgi:hypothetical protein
MIPPQGRKRGRALDPANNLRDDIKIVQTSGNPFDIWFPRDLNVPLIELEFTLTNISPYLDTCLVSSHIVLSVGRDEKRADSFFAEVDDYKEFHLRRRDSIPIRFRGYLNPYQVEIIRQFVAGNIWLEAIVFVHLRSRIGTISAMQSFTLRKPDVR